MEPTLDQVRQELADILEQLIVLPKNAYARRSELRDRQHELRQLSARMVEAEPQHDTEALKTAYERLQDVRDRLVERRLRSASASVADAVQHAIETGVSKSEIVSQLEAILEELRGSD